ncbi:MAG: Tll0287-like domain-containing protein [Pseudomonadota bacterium]
MSHARTSLTLLLPLSLAACATSPSPEQQARYTESARAAVNQAVKTLGGELKQAIQAGGPAHAIGVCKERAPKIAAAVSNEHGVSLRRVTFKNRNPKSAPDAWEAKVLRDFEQRLANGATAASLEHSEVVTEGNQKTFRYMKGLVVQEVCMTCHGTPETIPDAVKAKLAAEYPNDQATGYLPNMLRGAATVKKPL